MDFKDFKFDINKISAVNPLDRINQQLAESKKNTEEQLKGVAQRNKEKDERDAQILEELKKLGNTLNLLVDEFEKQIQVSSEDKLETQKLLAELKQITLSSEDKPAKDKKIFSILKNGMNLGSQILLPLLVEYIKYEAKTRLGLQNE